MPFDEMNILDLKEISFSQLNEIVKKRNPKSMPINRYFNEMDLPDDAKSDRKELARKLEDVLFDILAALYVLAQYGNVGWAQSVKEDLEESITNLVKDYTYPDSTMETYIARYADEFVDTTMSKIEQLTTEEDIEKLAYWFSEDRARYNAENEANTILNIDDYNQAVSRGFTQKQWITMKDENVRRTHAMVDDTIIPIDEFFVVGEALLRFPKDTEYGYDYPEEIVNCRCTVRYF